MPISTISLAVDSIGCAITFAYMNQSSRTLQKIPSSSVILLLMALVASSGCGQRTQLVMLGMSAECPPSRATSRIDRPVLKGTDGRYLYGGLIFTSQGNNISYIAFPKNHDQVANINTPELGLSQVIHGSNPPGTQILANVNKFFRSENGLGFVTKATKMEDVATRDNLHPATSWSVRQYIYFPDLVVVASSLIIKGDVEVDYDLAQEIAESLAIRKELAAVPLELFQNIESEFEYEIARLRDAAPKK